MNKFERLFARGVSTSITQAEFWDLYNYGHAVNRTVNVLPDGNLEGEVTWHYRGCKACLADSSRWALDPHQPLTTQPVA